VRSDRSTKPIGAITPPQHPNAPCLPSSSPVRAIFRGAPQLRHPERLPSGCRHRQS
jgi:hypothetical protein